MYLSQNLRKYRIINNLSQEDVAEYCNNNDIEFTADGDVFVEPT